MNQQFTSPDTVDESRSPRSGEGSGSNENDQDRDHMDISGTAQNANMNLGSDRKGNDSMGQHAASEGKAKKTRRRTGCYSCRRR